MSPLKIKPKELQFKKAATSSKPLWEGPCGPGPQGGITQGLLSRYLACSERFRLKVMEGWRSADSFNIPIEYGSAWHLCEEELADTQQFTGAPLKNHIVRLCRQYPLQQSAIQLMYEFIKYQFPLYVDYWAQHPDVTQRRPLLQEVAFDIPYKLSSGRTVRLRGRWDSVDLIGEGKSAGVFLQENKTKSGIDEAKIVRMLPWDLQTMLYLVALETTKQQSVTLFEPYPLRGVRYNVIRRSSHRSLKSFSEKLEEDKATNRLGEWFARWKVEVTPGDLARFKRECLNPLLENLTDDFEHWEYCQADPKTNHWDYQLRAKRFPKHTRRHFRMPYVYSPILDGGCGDLDALLNEGSAVGLEKATTLFRELED